MRILSRLTAAFPLWVLVCATLALINPPLFTWFSGPLITIGLGVIMLSMGMTLGFDDFRRVGRERGRVLPGVLLQYTVMPALGWSLGCLLALPTPLAVGLVLVSCCPGGTASNVISYLAKADVALSVTMTALSTLLAALMTPTLTALLAGSRIDVSATGLFLDTVQVVILPVVAGALLKWRFPRAIEPVLPIAPLVAVLTITLIVASVIGAGREQILDAGPRLLLAVFGLHAFGFLFGYLAGKAVLGRETAARTVAIEVGMQNSGLGVVLARGNFANPLVAIPSAISTVAHSLIGSLVAAWWRRSAAGGELDNAGRSGVAGAARPDH
ncbi:MAG: bile acid:sodium symporter family protein [Vicinamibacterales bacterium]|nr:bile acid:sodium symporter family protein [Vicinamibacterales bacterium]HJN45041.1 bile acid:sodium symporter family protein [Vicinamibacterales bacterium]